VLGPQENKPLTRIGGDMPAGDAAFFEGELMAKC